MATAVFGSMSAIGSATICTLMSGNFFWKRG